MNLAGLSAAYPGFMAARQQDARTQAQELTNQDAMDDRASMEALGRAFGMPQQAPPPQGAGQPSVPRQPAPVPAGPPLQQGGGEVSRGDFPNPIASPRAAVPTPGTVTAAPPGVGMSMTGMPVGNAPPPQPQMAPPRPPMPQGAPGGMAAPQGGGQPQGGMMSLEQLTQRIRAANPGIEKNPRIFVKALERGQVLLAPEGRQELAAAKQQLAAQALDMKMQQFEATLKQKEATQLTAAEKLQMQSQLLDAKRENLQIAQAGMDRRGAEAREARLDLLIASLTGKKELQGQKDEAADKRGKTMNFGKLAQIAAKNGYPIADGATPEDAQRGLALHMAGKADALKPDPDTVSFLAESIKQDPSFASRLGRNDALKKAVYDKLAHLPDVDGGTLATARVALVEKQEAGRVVGRVEGATRQAAEEVAPFAKLVRESAAKVDNTKYPTLNTVMQAAKRGTGDPNVVALANNIAALKRGFTQAMARGGVSSVDAQRRSDEILSMNMAPAQLDAAITSMEKEISGITGATQRATKGIAAEAGGKTAPEPGSAPAGGAQDDPLGILK